MLACSKVTKLQAWWLLIQTKICFPVWCIQYQKLVQCKHGIKALYSLYMYQPRGYYFVSRIDIFHCHSYYIFNKFITVSNCFFLVVDLPLMYPRSGACLLLSIICSRFTSRYYLDHKLFVAYNILFSLVLFCASYC